MVYQAVSAHAIANSFENEVIWSAPAERSGDGALDVLAETTKLSQLPTVSERRLRSSQHAIQSAVAAALCRRTPNVVS
jgi:hypothetical protein